MLHTILWGVVIVVLVLWLLGFLFRITKGFIHILLIVAAVIILFNLLFH